MIVDNFRHFIITRFNLKLYDTDKKNAPTRTAEWLKERFDIFEKYCLPSVAAQTCKNFIWLCLFDAGTPDAYRKRIEGYTGICPQFCPVYYDAEQTVMLDTSLDATIRGIVADWIPSRILSTNLDNDDAFSIYAVERLQEEIRSAKNTGVRIYRFLYGYQYFTRPGLATGMRYVNNHFLSFSEPYGADRIKTIISCRHTSVVEVIETVDMETPKGMWLEVVHAHNVSNEFRINSKVRYLPLLKGRDFSDFGLPIRVSAGKQLRETLWLFPKYFISIGIRRLATKGQRKADRRKKQAFEKYPGKKFKTVI